MNSIPSAPEARQASGRGVQGLQEAGGGFRGLGALQAPAVAPPMQFAARTYLPPGAFYDCNARRGTMHHWRGLADVVWSGRSLSRPWTAAIYAVCCRASIQTILAGRGFVEHAGAQKYTRVYLPAMPGRR